MLFMSRKQRRRNTTLFAFVRFIMRGNAIRAIKNLNRMSIKGHALL